VPRRDVDQEISDLSVGNSFKVFGDGIEVWAGDEGVVGFDSGPGGLDEKAEIGRELFGVFEIIGGFGFF